MNEYELATLAIRKWGLWAAFGQIAIGLGQIAVVWFGIRVMRQAGERPAKEQDQRHTQIMADQRTRHDEAMLALRELIARTGRAEPAPGAGDWAPGAVGK